MTYILNKQPAALSIQAGSLAKQLINQEGLQARHVDIIPGAAGGPKGIGIQGLDQAIFGSFLPQSEQRRALIGSSIGSWRFASIMAWGAKQGTERLAELYTQMDFYKGMSRQQVSQVCRDMLEQLVSGREQDICQHTDYHLTVLAVKSQHIFNSDRTLPLLASVSGIIATNMLNRHYTRLFMQRVVVQPQHELKLELHQAHDFSTHYHDLNCDNIKGWLMASGSIPGVMSAIYDIPNTPGCYRDGGLIDYHLDLPFPSQGIVLYPHFSHTITPGWFDKFVKWRKANPLNHARTLLISPSRDFLASLPLGRLPDRKDFTLLERHQRIKLWKQCIAESQRLGDEFLELVEKQNFGHVIKNLG